jgi:hypothetical protein
MSFTFLLGCSLLPTARGALLFLFPSSQRHIRQLGIAAVEMLNSEIEATSAL